MSLGRCPHQGGLPAALTRVVSGAARQERVHGLEISGSRRHHEDGLPALHRGVRIGAGGQQQLHDGAAPVRARHRQRRHAVAVHGVDAGARTHQQRRGLRIIVIRGPVQRGRSVDLRGIHVDTRLEEAADARHVASLRGIGERRPFGAEGCAGEPEQQENESTHSSAMHVRLLQVTYSATGSKRSSTFPLLSPNESRWTPTRSSSVR